MLLWQGTGNEVWGCRLRKGQVMNHETARLSALNRSWTPR
jgi:hypothetical protein